MKAKQQAHRLIALMIVGVALGFSPTLWASKSRAPEKKHGSEKGHDHDEHAEEEGHDEHGEEENHGGKNSHAHGEGKEKDEHGHGHGDHEEEEEGGSRFGPGKAITAANKKDGIQLSEKASKTLGLSYVTVSGNGTFRVPLKSVVFSQDEVGIYRFKAGWHKLLDVELVSKTASEAVIKTPELNSGDQIAKDGVPLLRAAELEAWGGSGDGHGH